MKWKMLLLLPAAWAAAAVAAEGQSAGVISPEATGVGLTFKTRALEQLVARVPGILRTYDEKTGRFGSGLFVVGDQNHLFPLAVAYATASPRNRYHRDAKLLEVIMKGGDALIEVQDPQGRWRF
ncbi:MAG: hypothetical protein FJ399_17900, partial [Verrucomicrobia bacterium]|nr:hypothetical protein [Verrucomicrobiota bacterium]